MEIPKTLKEQGLCGPKCSLKYTVQCVAICGISLSDMTAMLRDEKANQVFCMSHENDKTTIKDL